jgi:hypothetical protein
MTNRQNEALIARRLNMVSAAQFARLDPPKKRMASPGVGGRWLVLKTHL